MARVNPRHRVEAGRSGREEVGSGGGLLLALETATRVLGVALMRGERIVAELAVEGPRVHSERVLPAIDRVLAEAGVGLGDLDALAVSAGPGSFTGLRVGIATVKGLAFGRDLPVVPVPTLGALRRAAAGAPGPVACLLDARRGEVYAGCWSGAGEEAAVVVEESVFAPEALAACLPPGTTLVAGEDAAAGAAAVVEAGQGAVSWLDDREVPVRAGWVAELGAVGLAAGAAVAPEALLPRYVRRAEAEVKRTGEALEPAPGKGPSPL